MAQNDFQQISINTALTGSAKKRNVKPEDNKTAITNTIKITIENNIAKNTEFELFDLETPRLLAINNITLYKADGKFKSKSTADEYGLQDNKKILYKTANADDNVIAGGEYFIITYTYNINKK